MAAWANMGAGSSTADESRAGTPFASGWVRHGLGLLAAISAFSLLSWHLTRPALWLDESATVLGTQRTWSHLWLLLGGADAPLTSFYALLKVLTSLTRDVFPNTGAHLELLYRWPSVAAAVVATWVLIVWLARRATLSVVLGTGVFLLLSASFSRYGQEARPYALVLLSSVVCTALWTTLISTRRRLLWGSLYALSIVILVAANSLAVTLVVAHLVAALVVPQRNERRTAVLRTIIAGAVGGLLVSPLAVVVTLHGRGATRIPQVNPTTLSTAFVHLFTEGDHRWLWVGALLPLAFVGLTRVNTPKYQAIARLAAAWAIVPTLLWLAAVLIRPNLLIGRYMFFILPGWAILGGIGFATVVELGRRLTSRAVPAALLGGGLAVVVVAFVVFGQIHSLQVPRTVNGHGEDIRPALALADTPANEHLPILVTSVLGATEISAYDRADEHRLIGVVPQRDQHPIWPSVEPPLERNARLRAAPRLVMLMRPSSRAGCNDIGMERTAADVTRCMPNIVRRMKYRVESFDRGGRLWTFAVLVREGPQPYRPAG